MNEFAIELTGEHREDGSVCIYSEDLPMFCVVGATERDALDVAMEILPDYLKANVPEFVDVRPVRSARHAISREDSILPAHMIFSAGKRNDAGSTPQAA